MVMLPKSTPVTRVTRVEKLTSAAQQRPVMKLIMSYLSISISVRGFKGQIGRRTELWTLPTGVITGNEVEV